VNRQWWILVLLVAALVIATPFVFGAPAGAIPVLVVVGIGAFALEVARRRRHADEMTELRGKAEAQKTDFTPRDKETLT
jgi:Sec-independent protein secretion pathway component TatC